MTNRRTNRIAKFFKRLGGDRSGNAALMVALGMPVLIGGTGFAVDTAQWYTWKQELQYATDQAAIAGAWARSKDVTMDDYSTRADQEFDNNLAVTKDFASDPDISLADYNGGDDNSVIVSATATSVLPFSHFLTGKAATISVSSQAQFEAGGSYTSCIVATDRDDDGAITLRGSAKLTAGCGMAALSTSDNAIVVNGNPDITAGYILAAGGIDDSLADLGDNELLEYVKGLEDPYEGLVPPNNSTPRSLQCPKKNQSSDSTWTAYEVETVSVSYRYAKGSNSNNASPTTVSNPRQGRTDETDLGQQTYASQPQSGTTQTENWNKISGNGKNSIWEITVTRTTNEYSNVQQSEGSSGTYTVQPGTYSDFTVQCDTVMSGGVYVIDGGTLDINAQDRLTGNGIMFVLKNGAGLKINGGSNINLTAMTAAELISAGVASDMASKLEGMLIFEDPESEGNTKNKINGNASTILNGIVYLPSSHIDFTGSAGVTSRCFMLAAKTIDIGGNADMSSFCPAGLDTDTVVATTQSRVRLVA